MGKTLEEIRTELPDCHNREFMVRYNWALQALEKDDEALITFNLTILDTMKLFAKNNGKDVIDYLDMLKIIALNDMVDD